MEYRVAQLEALGRFLEEKKQDILEAAASDMGKVRGERVLAIRVTSLGPFIPPCLGLTSSWVPVWGSGRRGPLAGVLQPP